MARFVNNDEYNKKGSLPSGRGHIVRRYLMAMEVGKILLVTRAEWDWKGKTPNAIVQDIEKKTTKKFEFSNTADFKAWFIKRLE